MKHKLITSIIVTSAAVLMNSCAPATPTARIKKNPASFEQLSNKDQELAKQGKIKEGMDKNAVLLALGKPARQHEGSKNGVSFTKWIYTDLRPYYGGSFNSSFGHRGYRGSRRFRGGFGHGGFSHGGFGFGSSLSYVSSIRAIVEFDNNNKVTNWSSYRF